MIAGLGPGLVGGQYHSVVAVLAIDIGPVAYVEFVVLVEHRIEVSLLAIEHRPRHTLLLVEFAGVEAVEIVADGVEGIGLAIERLVDVGQEGDFTSQGMYGAVFRSQVGLCDIDVLHLIGAVAAEVHQLLVEHIDVLLQGAGCRVVAARNVVLDELLLQPLAVFGAQGIVVEGAVEWSPDGVSLRGREHRVIACLTEQVCKLRQLAVVFNILPQRLLLGGRHMRVSIEVVVPIGAGRGEK